MILADEEEAKLFIFFHELRHIEDGSAPEYECDDYARGRILERRKGK